MSFRDWISESLLIPLGKSFVSRRSYFKAKAYQDFLERAQYEPCEKLYEHQNTLLQVMIQHAYENVPYYRDLFTAHGIRPQDIRSREDLTAIPYLTKNVLVRNLDRLKAGNRNPSTLSLVSTGGTTGTPIRFYRDQTSEYMIDGNNWRFFRFCGYSPGKRVAMMWGNEADLLRSSTLHGRLKKIMDNEMMLNFYDLSEKRLKLYVDLIKQKSPLYWKGFSSAIYIFVRYLKTNRIDIPIPRAVIITSDKIDDLQRKEIEGFLGSVVFDEYGCREFSIMGFECEAHQGIHVGIENAVIELIDATEDGYGEVVVTSLTNWGMPFIRYKLGDASKFVDGACPCGRTLPRLESIGGRVADFVVTRSEKLIYGDFFAHLFYSSTGIEYYQVIQKEIGRVIIYIQGNEFFQEAEVKRFLATLDTMMQKDLEADIIVVPAIERHRSGKRRSVISEISHKYMC